jgi:hypothetical protein
MSPDFHNDFILYTLASDIVFATILTQKNDEGNELPIGFMSSRMQGK